MKAMILSAGFGTRLQQLTKDLPKALVKYNNVPMINYQIERLMNAGVEEIIVNAHHHHDKISEYFSKHKFKVKINVITEHEILGTGGGILNAADFFRNDKFFVVLNVDIDTNMNLSDMISFHQSENPFATLAVQKRISGKYLEFDASMNLIGRQSENSSTDNLFAFNGIHIISNEIFNRNFEVKFTDILDIYFEVIKNKKVFVKGFDAGDCFFKDLGKISSL